MPRPTRVTTFTAYVETSMHVRERERRADAAEHGEDADAEAEQRGDAGGEDDDQQDQRQRQRHHLGAAQVARQIRVEVVGERDVTSGGDAECAGVHLAADLAILRARLREVDVQADLHEHAVLVGRHHE